MKKNYHKSGLKKMRYKEGRYRNDWVDAVHFNMSGKKPCAIIVVDPHHSTDPSKVTCRYCLTFLNKRNIS